jgi:hypothetical protein
VAANVVVGDGDAAGARTALINPGAITGDVDVLSDGEVALDPPDALAITGNLTFDGGAYDVVLGPTPSLITVHGDVTINGGTIAGDGYRGVLPGPGDFKIIDFDGNLTGTFDNAPTGQTFLLGGDAVRVTHYGPAAAGVTLSHLAAAPKGTVTGSEVDGTNFTIRLAGGGELAYYDDAVGGPTLVARNTTLKSKITVTTKVNASDDLMSLGRVVVDGDLGSFSAPTVALLGSLTAYATPSTAGTVKSLALYQAVGALRLDGALSALTTTGPTELGLEATSVGAVKAAGTLRGAGDWDVPLGIGSITAGSLAAVTINAGYVGTLSVVGNPRMHLVADATAVTLNIGFNDGTRKAYGLKSLTVSGSVLDSVFDVRGGNVGSVRVGRFIRSDLFVGYTLAYGFGSPGYFTAPFRLEKFTTTAAAIGLANSPLDYAFSGSRIAADTIGTVRLSSLRTDDSGVPMGIQFHTPGCSVRVKQSDAPAGEIPRNLDLTPAAGALAGDFYYLVVP